MPGGPQRWQARLRAANVLHELERGDEAYAELRELQADAAVDDDARRDAYLLEAELRQKDKDDAARTRRLRPRPGRVSRTMARCCMRARWRWERRDDIARAEADFRKILVAEPDNVAALNALGYTLADRTTRYAEALELIDRARVAEPDNAAIIDSYGWVLYRLGRNDEALVELRRAFALQKDPEIAAHLGEVLWVTRQARTRRAGTSTRRASSIPTTARCSARWRRPAHEALRMLRIAVLVRGIACRRASARAPRAAVAAASPARRTRTRRAREAGAGAAAAIGRCRAGSRCPTARTAAAAASTGTRTAPRYRVALSAPVTRQSWRLSGDAARARGWKAWRAARAWARTPAELLREATGWEIPVDGAGDWVRGAARRRGTGPAQLQFGADGRLSRIEQGGWTIDYSDWQPAAGGRLELPQPARMPRQRRGQRAAGRRRLGRRRRPAP